MPVTMCFKVRKNPGFYASLLGLTLAACSSPEITRAPSAEREVFTEWGTLVCGNGTTDGLPNEEYEVRSINRLLELNVELRDETGLAKITSCDEARIYWDKYHAYLFSHPEFAEVMQERYAAIDWEGAIAPFPAQPAGATESGTTQKILNGDRVDNRPVVWMFDPVNRVGCSGVFVSDNWILSAAHCFRERTANEGFHFRAIRRFKDLTPQQITVKDGLTPDPNLLVEIRVSKNPDWPGVSLRSGASGGDFEDQIITSPVADLALAFVNEDQYRTLFPSVGAMRISTLAPFVGQLETLYGAGAERIRTSAIDPLPGVLRTGPGGATTPITRVTSHTFEATAATNVSRICKGDSGSPAVRTAPQVRSDFFTVSQVNMIDGIASAIKRTGDVLAFCANDPTDVMLWSRTDLYVKRLTGNKPAWIEKTIASAGVVKECDFFPGIARCWATPCSTNGDCFAAPHPLDQICNVNRTDGGGNKAPACDP